MAASGISIVIPTYNRANLVRRALRSALNSRREDDEIIVVDDGSTDETAQILGEYGGRIIYVRKPHGGAGKARNAGIDRATKPLVAFLDSDDAWIPGSLELRRELMQARPDLVFCFGDYIVRTSTEELRQYVQRRHEAPLRWDEMLGPGAPFSSLAPLRKGDGDPTVYIGNFYAAQLSAEYVLTSTVLVNRERAGRALRFAEDLPTLEDLLCWVQLARAGSAAYVDRELVWQYAHSGFRISAAADGLTRAEARLRVIERTFAKDAAFLAYEGTRYRQVLQDLHRLRARMLLVRGRTREAQWALVKDPAPPRLYVLMAHLPGSLVRWLLKLRRLARALSGAASVLSAMMLRYDGSVLGT